MKWHKISDELPSLNIPVLIAVKKCKKYIYTLAVRYSKNYWAIGMDKGYDIILFTHWAEIESPENE